MLRLLLADESPLTSGKTGGVYWCIIGVLIIGFAILGAMRPKK